MRLESKKHLEDMRRATELLAQFGRGRSKGDYVSDPLFRSAVERQLEIIGEAVSRLKKEDADAASKISDVQKIISFRNILTHAYDVVDENVVWDVLINKIPVLRREIDSLLE